MHTKISPQTKRELLQALRSRYQTATKLEKSRILDEYVALAECHRKHAIRLLTFIAQAEFDQHRPQVIVGSSRGGTGAMNINSGDTGRLCRHLFPHAAAGPGR